MGYVYCPEEFYVSSGDVELVQWDWTDHLGSELIVSSSVSPLITEISTTDLTISSISVSTASATIAGRTVAAYQSCQAYVSGFTSGSTYGLLAKVVTDGSRTIYRAGRVICK